jgi:hypothetical protein
MIDQKRIDVGGRDVLELGSGTGLLVPLLIEQD